MTARASPTIALFPEASFGAALNCVGIAQALRDARRAAGVHLPSRLLRPVRRLRLSRSTSCRPTPLADSERQTTGRPSCAGICRISTCRPLDQLDTYVAPTWEAIVDTAIRRGSAAPPIAGAAEARRRRARQCRHVPGARRPPACPWVRVISCAETELPDPDVPPYLSGLAADDAVAAAVRERAIATAVAPAHDRFNRFRAGAGLPRAAAGHLPRAFALAQSAADARDRAARARRSRSTPKSSSIWKAASARKGHSTCRSSRATTGRWSISASAASAPCDVGLIERMIAVFASLPARFIVNVGGFRDTYRAVPDNVYLDAWFPQPSVVAECDLFIHHGGNNSFCEALSFGVPSLIMPYCWDGHDNAQRAAETGVGLRLDRAAWTPDRAQLRDRRPAWRPADARASHCECSEDGCRVGHFARRRRGARPAQEMTSPGVLRRSGRTGTDSGSGRCSKFISENSSRTKAAGCRASVALPQLC